MTANKHIVITGSTKGIGYGLAENFLRHGCSVTVSGRSQKTADEAAARLRSTADADRVCAVACDVTNPIQVQKLWDESLVKFGKVDIWINNAGWSGEEGSVWERPADEIASVLTTNLIGTVYGAQVAMRGMSQQGFGAIYNMEGMGSDGRKHAGLTMYGTSKYGVHYFTESLALEAKETGMIVGSLRPGMVITDMIMERYKDRPADWERVKNIFNIIAERPETVTSWLVNAMLTNQKNGAILSFSSTWKMLWKFASSSFVKRDLFTKER
jgi:NAD(P)-dependent dehydrogenase (short-subunit alcohol dehydrogenase family)